MGSCKRAVFMLSFGLHGKKKKKRKDDLISIFFQDILHRQRNILQILVENVFFVAARSRFFTA